MFMDALKLTAEMISFRSINPPGNEQKISLFLQKLLSEYNFKIDCYEFEKDRPSFIASMDGTDTSLDPIVFAGHIDVVPAGKTEWQSNPFKAKIMDGKIFGRGSTDMKSGIACAISASINILNSASPIKRGIKIVIVAGEETGCQGSFHLKEKGVLGNAHLLVVPEPTDNLPVIAHKGSIRLIVRVTGKTAHSAMPEHGINAIKELIPIAVDLNECKFENIGHPILGKTTSAVTTIKGGENINSIPDLAECTVDIRTIPTTSNEVVINKIKEILGSKGDFEIVNNFPGFASDPDHQIISEVTETIAETTQKRISPRGASYYTDACALVPGFDYPPTIVIGPGLPELCHKTDEYCSVENIIMAKNIFEKLIKKYCL